MARLRWNWLSRTSKIVALCSAANFINSADRVIMPIAIVPMTDSFGWSLHEQGWILSAFAFGYLTSQVLGKSLQLCMQVAVRLEVLSLLVRCKTEFVFNSV